MKLKKIASLALAGIMAVSMLAGCNNGGNSNGSSSSEAPVTTDVVAAFNDAQSKNNDAKVTFSADSDLNNHLVLTLKDLNDKANETTLNNRLKLYTNVAVWNASASTTASNFYSDDATANNSKPQVDNTAEKVKAVTLMGSIVVDSTEAWNESTAIKVAAEEMNTLIGTNLVADSIEDLTTQHKGDKYQQYSYTGKVSMASELNADGTTYYYFAYIITQNMTQVEVKGN